MFNNAFDIEYKSYHNVVLTVSNDRIVGKLNKFITTKNFNNSCYQKNCGFPEKREYCLSKIEFIKIQDKYFLSFSCIADDSEKYFYNMTDKDIEKIKEKFIYQARDELKWAAIIIMAILFVSFVQTFIISKARKKGMDILN